MMESELNMGYENNAEWIQSDLCPVQLCSVIHMIEVQKSWTPELWNWKMLNDLQWQERGISNTC